MKSGTHTIILARHGETEFNRDRFVMGRMDSRLTEEGVRMARQVALIIQREQVDKVYSSPLGRALASARIYAEGTGAPILIRDDMAELAFGDWEGRAASEVKTVGRRLRNTWEDRPPGGESYGDAESRVSHFIRELRQQEKARRILVVGHAGVNRVFLRLWLGLDPTQAVTLHLPHDTVFILEDGDRVTAASADGHIKTGLSFDVG